MKKKQFGILKTIVIFILIILVFGIFSTFINNKNTFYLSIENKKIYSSENDICFYTNKESIIGVNLPIQNNDYLIKIYPNKSLDNDFEFLLNDVKYNFHNVDNLIDGFEIEKYESGFNIYPKGSLTEILQAVYKTAEVSNCDNFTSKDMFELNVSLLGKNSPVIKLYFTICVGVTGVELGNNLVF